MVNKMPDRFYYQFNDESIDDNVVVLVNALYDSFLAKIDDENGDS